MENYKFLLMVVFVAFATGYAFKLDRNLDNDVKRTPEKSKKSEDYEYPEYEYQSEEYYEYESEEYPEYESEEYPEYEPQEYPEYEPQEYPEYEPQEYPEYEPQEYPESEPQQQPESELPDGAVDVDGKMSNKA